MISEHRMFRCSITYQVNTTVAVVRFSNTSACKELNLMPRETPSSRGLFFKQIEQQGVCSSTEAFQLLISAANFLRLFHSKQAERTDMTITGGWKIALPPAMKMLQARILTTMGPRTSRPILRVLGMATRIPPKISKHLTKAIKPLPPTAPQKRAGGEPGSGAGNGGSKGRKN